MRSIRWIILTPASEQVAEPTGRDPRARVRCAAPYDRSVVSVFLVVWSIVALALGLLFAFKPEVPADMYIAQMARTRVSNRLRERLAPRAAILVWYRIGGVLFMLLSVVMPALVLSGVIPVDEG